MRRHLLAEVARGARVLEVGSGGGQLAVAIASEREDLSITGLDLSPEQVARATRRARTHRVALAGFRTFVAGHSIDLDDARALAAAIPEASWTIERIPDSPGLLVTGRRLASAQT